MTNSSKSRGKAPKFSVQHLPEQKEIQIVQKGPVVSVIRLSYKEYVSNACVTVNKFIRAIKAKKVRVIE